ncbi:MAG: LysM peptidoglycan-binding domain-containing protein, partial [Flammeovirgaceae bacterium]|nr:LysM peptidoglycan-binding domain-containing protein [Flammeovirgaceae bacterium]
MRYFFAFVIILFSIRLLAQAPEVPHKMQFAGLTLTIRDDARREIQKDVDALTQSSKYYTIKVERARTYFPVIEKIFEEERVPEDFKFLVLQESSLVPDAVSVSNAVGYWQFKDFTAIEMGLRVDKQIDERMNIVSSTRAAAQYIKKNNYYFNNWLYALQAYQMGAGGVIKAVKDYEPGTKHMEVTSATYWYVKKFLAHKVAFEKSVEERGATQLVLFQTSRKSDLNAFANGMAIEPENLLSYNKWARTGEVPDDKSYTIAIPVEDTQKKEHVLASANRIAGSEMRVTPRVSLAKSYIRFVNGLPAIQAIEGESSSTLAKRADTDLSSFLKYNDISISDRLMAGEFYYLKRKHKKATTLTHKSGEKESLWAISQKYGIRLSKLQKYNPGLQIKVGTLVWLTPKNSKPEKNISEQPVILDTEKSFAWSVTPVVESNPTEKENQEVAKSSNDKIGDVAPQEVSITATVRSGTHEVKTGETFYSIAKLYKLEVMNLVNLNKLNLKDPLKPGQILQITDNQEVVDSKLVYHKVKPSETLHSIAREYEVTI